MSQCFRYEQLARELAERIRNGFYRTGERLPGIRPLRREFGVRSARPRRPGTGSRNRDASTRARAPDSMSARVSHPRGGFQLWVQFPPQIDGLELYRRAHAAGMSIAPGVLFSVTDKYRSCIRLNAALPWSDTLEQALIHLCRLAAGLAQEPSRTAPVESH